MTRYALLASHLMPVVHARSGTRSGLWGSMVDAVMGLRPLLVAWENVLGARSAAAETRRDETRWDETR